MSSDFFVKSSLHKVPNFVADFVFLKMIQILKQEVENKKWREKGRGGSWW